MKKKLIFISLLLCISNLKSFVFNMIDSKQWKGSFDTGIFFINPGDYVIDVSANIGDWTAEVLRKTDNNVSVLLFEPVPTLYSNLINRYSSNQSIQCFPIALHENKGIRNFFINVTAEGKDTGGSSFYLTHPFLQAIPMEVETDNLDSFCQEHGISHINFLKVDAEAADIYIIYGAKKYIEEKRINFIQLEHGNGVSDAAGANFSDLYKFLTENDYLVFFIHEGNLVWQKDGNANYCYGDFLAISKNKIDCLRTTPENSLWLDKLLTLINN